MNKLDDQILDLISATEGGDVVKEVDSASKYKEDLFQAIILCEEVLNKQELAIKQLVIIKEQHMQLQSRYQRNCPNWKERLLTEKRASGRNSGIVTRVPSMKMSF